jgi:hypothetical protein
LRFKSEGKIHLSCILANATSHSDTRFTIDPHCFFTTPKVTAERGSFPPTESLEILVIFLGDIFTSAISFR